LSLRRFGGNIAGGLCEDRLMIIRADSDLGALLTLLVLFGGFVGVLAALVLLVSRKFRAAAGALLVSTAVVGLYIAATIVAARLAPQRVIDIGSSYCMDIWCIGVERVRAVPRGQDVLYKVDVRIFSDGNSVRTSARGANVYLLDEQGRRYELMNDPSVPPVDTPLDPRQSVETTLTFAVAPDARQLFLPCSYHHIGDEPSAPFWVRLYFGSEAGYMHKRTMLRVL
jgi:hypothetical protein